MVLSSKVKNKLKAFSLEEKYLFSKEGNSFLLSSVCFITSLKGSLQFVISDKEKHLVKGNLKEFSLIISNQNPHFIRTHKNFIVNLKKVRGSLRNSGAGFKLRFKDLSDYALVSKTYSKKVAKALGVKTLAHNTPPSDYAKKLRKYALITFGGNEIENLDKTNKKEVSAFKKKWDIRRFSSYKMHKYFSEKTTSNLDKTKIIRNLIWQAYSWLSWGISESIDGTIRTLWYKWVGHVLYKHKLNSPNPENDQNLIYARVKDFVSMRLFSYKDFGFENPLSDTSLISDLNWHLIVFAEKQGMATFTHKLADSIGASYLASSGQVPWITGEYFADELKIKLAEETRPIKIFTMVDFNPDGYDIQRNFVKRLKFNGIKNIELIPVITIDLFPSDDIKHLKKPLVSYYKETTTSKPKPATNKDKSKLQEALKWFNGYESKTNPLDSWPPIKDDRLIQESERPEGGHNYTLFGLDADVLPRSIIRPRFDSLTTKYLNVSKTHVKMIQNLNQKIYKNLIQTFYQNPQEIPLTNFILNKIPPKS